MIFPVSGVEINPIIPPLIAFIISATTSPAGISGSFLLLPYQVSFLNFTSPAVSPTNLIFNIVAIPGGLYSFIKDGLMAWPIAWVMSAGTLPGILLGSWLRINYLHEPKIFKLFLGFMLLLLGTMLLLDLSGLLLKTTFKNKDDSDYKKFPYNKKIITKSFSAARIEYYFMGVLYSCKTMHVYFIALFIGLIGGIYGLGGGALITPLLVSILSLPIYSVAGSALFFNFLNSITGVLVY